jgi:hypothetical protein
MRNPQPSCLRDVCVPLLQLFLQPGGALLHGLELGGQPLHVGLHLGEELVALREEGGVRVHQAGQGVQHHVLLPRLRVGGAPLVFFIKGTVSRNGIGF